MRKSPKSDSYANWNNRKHKNPSPEEIVKSQWYAFTYNPEVQPLRPNFQLDLITWHNGMDNIFKSLKYCEIKLRPELSQGSRWHYHGQIQINEIMKFYIFDLPVLRENGAYEIDSMSEVKISEKYNSWEDYCKKQEKMMKDICTEYGIPYHYDKSKIMKVKIQPLQDTKFTELIKICPTSEYIED